MRFSRKHPSKRRYNAGFIKLKNNKILGQNLNFLPYFLYKIF